MTRAYSTVLEQPAPQVWKIVRDFNNYPVWVGGAGESRTDPVGGFRSVLDQERRIRFSGNLARHAHRFRASFGKWLESLRTPRSPLYPRGSPSRPP